LTLGGIYLHKRNKSSIEIFFIVSIFFSPIIIAIIHPMTVLAPRYFVINLLFITLAISQALDYLFNKNKLCKIMILSLVGMFMLAQFTSIINFTKDKRGRYSQALEFIIEDSQSKQVTVGSDHDFRNALILNFYKSRIAEGSRLHYLDSNRWRDSRPDYFIIHEWESKTLDPLIHINVNDHISTYKFLKVFPFYPKNTSGWNWHVYKKQPD